MSSSQSESVTLSIGGLLTLFPNYSGFVRHFCSECGSHLYGIIERWLDNVYLMASAVDTDFPQPNADHIYRVWLNKESKCSCAATPDIDNMQNFAKSASGSMEA